MKKLKLAFFTVLIASMSISSNVQAYEQVVFSFKTEDLDQFEKYSRLAKAAGATHVEVSYLPDYSWWQMPDKTDPYPQWVFVNASVFKLYIPEKLKGHLPAEPAAEFMSRVKERCRILRELELKAAFRGSEPMMLPESVFEKHPLWRGPRVDHPARSRKAQFSPAVTNSEVLALYRESMEQIIRQCPEIDIFRFLTNDSGTGFDWHNNLYDGYHGSTLYRNFTTGERTAMFMGALQQGARDGGGQDITISIHGTGYQARVTESLQALSALGSGMVLENMTADRRRWMSEVGFDWYTSFTYPLVGIPQHARFIRQLDSADNQDTKVLYVDVDLSLDSLYFDLFSRFNRETPDGYKARAEFMSDYASEVAGQSNAKDLVEVWVSIDESIMAHAPLNYGGHIFLLGSQSHRWINRPFVPFAAELSEEEYGYYRPYLFQARGVEHAEDLADLQASRFVAGQSAAYIIYCYMNEARNNISSARNGIAKVIANTDNSALKERLNLLDLRLQVYTCLCNNAVNAPGYQEKIDYIREKNIKPDWNQRFSLDTSLFRRDILETARLELDNTAVLLKLLESTDQPLIHQVSDPGKECTWDFGPNLKDQLRLKLKIMRAHWEDYNRIFTEPNL